MEQHMARGLPTKEPVTLKKCPKCYNCAVCHWEMMQGKEVEKREQSDPSAKLNQLSEQHK